MGHRAEKNRAAHGFKVTLVRKGGQGGDEYTTDRPTFRQLNRRSRRGQTQSRWGHYLDRVLTGQNPLSQRQVKEAQP